MVTGLLDTSVIVDLLRSHTPAQQWLVGQSQLGVTTAIWLEVIQGARNQQAQKDAIRLLKAFEQVELTSADIQWAIQQLTRFALSHNIGAFDCLIAATNYRLQLPLYTTNLKHFAPLLGSLAQKPF